MYFYSIIECDFLVFRSSLVAKRQIEDDQKIEEGVARPLPYANTVVGDCRLYNFDLFYCNVVSCVTSYGESPGQD